mgnify:FL=1
MWFQTKNVPLEDMAQLFGDSDQLAKHGHANDAGKGEVPKHVTAF